MEKILVRHLQDCKIGKGFYGPVVLAVGKGADGLGLSGIFEYTYHGKKTYYKSCGFVREIISYDEARKLVRQGY